MANYLIFQLYAPMVSWGQAAVGEVRHGSPIPSRSAMLGLLAATLGIKRQQEDELNQFNRHYHFAVRPFIEQASWLTDYHTIEVPKENKKICYQTRHDELIWDRQSLGTLLSSREYHCDTYYHIALRETNNAPYSLSELQQALERPVFPLYLGRKSCPLALPLLPTLIEGSLAEAFKQAERLFVVNEKLTGLASFIQKQKSLIYYWEQDDDTQEFVKQQTRQLSDNPISRRRWQFSARKQHSGILSGGQ